MSQTIALLAKAPQVNVSEIVDDIQRQQLNAYRIRGSARDDQLGEMETRQKLDEGHALDRYRTRMKEKDPNAIEELDAYPEMQKKLHDAFDGMSPEQYREASAKARAFGEAARRVSSFPDGSAEQAQAWATEIDKLHQGGFIDEQYRDLWKKSGPNMEIINEALNISKWAESYTGKNAVNRARAENYEGKTKNEAALTEAKIGTEKSKAGLNEKRGEVAEKNANSMESYRTREGDRKAADTEADNVRADRKTDASIEQGNRRVGVAEKNAESLDGFRLGKRTLDRDKLTADIADDEADNVRADKDLERKREKDKMPKASGSGKTTTVGGEGESGLSENEYGRRIRDIRKIIERRREKEFLNNDQVLELERELRRQYRIPVDAPSISGLDPAGGTGAGTGGKTTLEGSPAKPKAMGSRDTPYQPKSRAEAQALPAGAWFVDPKGNLIQKQ